MCKRSLFLVLVCVCVFHSGGEDEAFVFIDEDGEVTDSIVSCINIAMTLFPADLGSFEDILKADFQVFGGMAEKVYAYDPMACGCGILYHVGD